MVPATEHPEDEPHGGTCERLRVGLVLGAGGVVGQAFHAGVLAALEQDLGWDARTADVIVGTSAGSVSAAALTRLRRAGTEVVTFEPTGKVLRDMGLNAMADDRSDRVMRAAFFAAGSHALRPDVARALAAIARRPNRADLHRDGSPPPSAELSPTA